MYKSNYQNKNVRSLLQKSFSSNLLVWKRKSIAVSNILVLPNISKDFCPSRGTFTIRESPSSKILLTMPQTTFGSASVSEGLV